MSLAAYGRPFSGPLGSPLAGSVSTNAFSIALRALASSRARPPALPCGRLERGPAGNVEHASLRKRGDPAYWCAHPKQGGALMTPFAGTYSSGNALNDQEFAHIVMGSRSRRSGAHRGSRPAAGGFDAAHRRHDGIECDGRRAQGVRRAQNCDPYSALAARR
jgi:hypothetical protein